DVHLLLEDELPISLDGVLRVRLLLDHHLDSPAEDAALPGDPLAPPLGAAEAGLADRRGHAGAAGEDTDLDRIGGHSRLRLGRGGARVTERAAGGQGSAGAPEELASRRGHE